MDEAALEGGSAGQSNAAASGKTVKVTDGEILGVLGAVNQGEVKAGELAKERSSAAAVDEFAQHMIDAHSQAQGTVLAVSGLEPTSSGLSRSIEEQGTAEMAKLQGLQGAEFDRAYAESQAKMHQQVLDTIDSILLKQATSREVKSLLETLRPQVAEHLAHAQQLETPSAPAGAGAP
jgi:putative membrane protein